MPEEIFVKNYRAALLAAGRRSYVAPKLSICCECGDAERGRNLQKDDG